MDFSSNILIDFGLNLAGYLIAGLLVYILVARRRAPLKSLKSIDKTVLADVKTTDPAKLVLVANSQSADPEFVFLSKQKQKLTDQIPVVDETIDDAPEFSGRDVARRANKRAICREARLLLAKGKSHGELMQQLPLTKNELEMLSMAGRA